MLGFTSFGMEKIGKEKDVMKLPTCFMVLLFVAIAMSSMMSQPWTTSTSIG